MRTDEDLRRTYADLLDGDTVDLVPIVRDLEAALPLRQPADSLTTAFNRTLAERAARGSTARRSFLHHFHARTAGLGWPMQGMSLAVLILLLAALVGSVAYAASTFIRVAPPEQPNVLATSSPVIGMFFPPPWYAQYRPIGPRRAARESGSALAYLRQPPAGFSTSVWIPVAQPLKVPTPRPAPGLQGISMAIRSVVQYRQGSHAILVALDQPSQRLAAKPLLLGEHTVHLANGHSAWTTVIAGSEESNMVATVNGNYLVVLASDLPMPAVERLATEAVVVPASGSLPVRHIPADWPPPLPPRSPPAGIWIRVVPSDLHASEAHGRLHLTFMFSIGNAGAAPARDIQTAIELPPVLARHAVDAPPHWHFSKLTTGGEAGFGGDMTVDVSKMSRATVQGALTRGIEVRVAWIDDAGNYRVRFITFRVRELRHFR